MAGRASHAAGNAAGRYNLRPRGRSGQQRGLRGAAALADSPLMGRLLEDLVAVCDAEVLPLLDATTRALLGRCRQACRDAVLRSPKLRCTGRIVGVKLKVSEFVGSVQLLAWAHASGCPSQHGAAGRAARHRSVGQIDKLQRFWDQGGCLWCLLIHADASLSLVSLINLT
jgi:hypothetical protein